MPDITYDIYCFLSASAARDAWKIHAKIQVGMA